MRQSTANKRDPVNSVDAEIGRLLLEVRIGVSAIRSIRMGLMQLTYAMAERSRYKGILLLVDTAITRERLHREWQLAASVLRPDILEHLSICIFEDGRFFGIPRDPDRKTQRILCDFNNSGELRESVRLYRTNASFVVLKVLLNHWLMVEDPVTTNWLARSCGFSYPTIARVIHSLGSLIERQRDRRITLRWFPREEFARMVAVSDHARSTVRFVDRSGSARTADAHLRRLEKLNPPGLAIGGVLGAKRYLPKLDIVGTPRVDISVHCHGRQMDLEFMTKLDPALKRIDDPREPAAIAVHAVRHIDPFFTERSGGLFWADPVECLLDLHEAQLELQAAQFLRALEQNRTIIP